jgi:hypothetical protein
LILFRQRVSGRERIGCASQTALAATIIHQSSEKVVNMVGVSDEGAAQ